MLSVSMAVRVRSSSRNTATRCGGGSSGFRFLAEVMAIVAAPRHPGRQWTRECPTVEREMCLWRGRARPVAIVTFGVKLSSLHNSNYSLERIQMSLSLYNNNYQDNVKASVCHLEVCVWGWGWGVVGGQLC